MGKNLLQTHALTVKEVRKSSFTLPDKTANSYSAKVFQATNHFRNSACAFIHPGDQPPSFLRNTHLFCSHMSQPAFSSPLTGIWPTQEPSREALTRTSAENFRHLDKRENIPGKYSFQHLHLPLDTSY